MRIQQKCPICEGHGQVAGGFYHTLPGCSGISNHVAETCKNCSGTGVVYVEQDGKKDGNFHYSYTEIKTITED